MKLSQRQEKGLREAIDKWDRDVVVDNGPANCGLCKLYLNKMCNSCPVLLHTGKRGCENTPYEEWDDHHEDSHPCFVENKTRAGCKTCLKLQRAEAKFLKSLLPEGAK